MVSISLLAIFVRDAYAYLDPGTGSYFFQIIIAAIIGGLFFINLILKRIVAFLEKFFITIKFIPTLQIGSSIFFVFHPFMFAIFSVLSLFAHNIEIVPFEHTYLPLVTVVILTLISFILLGYILKGFLKSGVIVSLFIFEFFSYGHLYTLIERFKIFSRIGPHKSLLFLLSLLFVSGVYACIRTRKSLNSLTRFLNIVSFCLVFFSLFNIGLYYFNTWRILRIKPDTTKEESISIDSNQAVQYPNIYYIILDEYARADILKEVYNYDNGDFLDYLKNKGFYMANKSNANYSQTRLSLASSLNMGYLDIVLDIDPVARRPRRRNNAIMQNDVFKFLKKRGYRIVCFSSAYDGTDIKKADIYLNTGAAINLFNNELRNLTPISIILFKLKVKQPYDLHREGIVNTFERLPVTVTIKGPIFVFAHITCPHPPFVFGAHGEEVNRDAGFTFRDNARLKLSRENYIKSYINQLKFINTMVIGTIDRIVAYSSSPPIIILQADHGSGSAIHFEHPSKANLKERLSIFNAYYLPENCSIRLYQSITPVNTFRLIFNYYFKANYNLLPDKSYFSRWSKPYAFVEYVPE
jgi:hypothetical protein